MLNSEQKKADKVSIGGQAVMEGVMMRGQKSMAIAVRDKDGVIRIESKRIKAKEQKNLFFRLPFVRGVVSFFSSLITGTKVLMRSAEVFGEDEPSKFEKFLADKFKINIMSVVTTISLILGFCLAILLFIILPQLAREGLETLFSHKFSIWAKNFIEGGLKLLIFIIYIALASLLKDIRRTFMYHGAEHKTITCFESKKELTIDNVEKCSKIHDRCGTTFMVFVIVVSIILFAVVESIIGQGVDKIFRVMLKIAFLPIVAGVSYELLKILSKTNSIIVLPLKLPGMFLQTMTTREPTEDMIEVAIASFMTVYNMDNDPNILEQEFSIPKKRSVLVKEVKEKLLKFGIDEQAESEWIVSIVLGIERSKVYQDELVTQKYIEKVNEIVDARLSGKPLWYCIGDTEFYGYKINVDERALIPRPETEILVEQAIKVIKNDNEVLDLCTGSGAIAIAIKKQTNAKVYALDISRDALELAHENAINNNAEIEFVESDMFSNLENKKFDVIVSNPPYIKANEILSLQNEVKDFEPIIALDGGVDGLDFYRIIAKNVKNHLKPDGVLLLECGLGQASLISQMFVDYKELEIIKDYSGIDRIVKVVF